MGGERNDMDRITGETLVNIDCGEDVVEFTFSDEVTCECLHGDECCESITVQDVNGDWYDFIGCIHWLR